jgi:hypothetical protein
VKAKAALASAPANAETANTRLAANRSARPESEKAKVPAMKPSCTAMVSVPTSAGAIDHWRARSS